MNELYHVSASPHVRSNITTAGIMYDVCIALTPAALFGVWRFGLYAALIIIVSMVSAVLSEAAYQMITMQKVTAFDGSALVTGMILALILPPEVPLWVPALGSVFAIIFVKQFFGGLGQNFMNPAAAARCFLLISFASIMGNYSVDGVSGATPLALLKEGGRIDLPRAFLGYTGGCIGEVSIVAVLIGGIYLIARKVISWKIPVTIFITFAVFEILFSGHGFNLTFLVSEFCAGGLAFGAIFMATDYVSCPITPLGAVLYAVIIGVLAGIFRTFGPAAEGMSYAIILADLFVPLIEAGTMPKAFGANAKPVEKKSATGIAMFQPAFLLVMITAVAGLMLGVVYTMTKGTIEQAELQKEAAAYAAVCPDASSFEKSEELEAVIASLTAEDGTVADGRFGQVVYDSAYAGLDASGNLAGYVVNTTSKEGFGGAISISLGVAPDGTTTGIQFLSISETAGLGMNATKPEFYEQYVGKKVDSFTWVKSGASADNEVDQVSGASYTSTAVTNAVNAALYAVQQLGA